MAFQRGHPKAGGRRAGVPNKRTAEMRERAAQLIRDPLYQKRLRERLLKGRAGRIELLLWQYACGKPAGDTTAVASPEQYAAMLARIQSRQEQDIVDNESAGRGAAEAAAPPRAEAEDQEEPSLPSWMRQ